MSWHELQDERLLISLARAQIVEHESGCLDEIDSEEGKQKYFKEMEK